VRDGAHTRVALATEIYGWGREDARQGVEALRALALRPRARIHYLTTRYENTPLGQSGYVMHCAVQNIGEVPFHVLSAVGTQRVGDFLRIARPALDAHPRPAAWEIRTFFASPGGYVELACPIDVGEDETKVVEGFAKTDPQTMHAARIANDGNAPILLEVVLTVVCRTAADLSTTVSETLRWTGD
jgi:hypothetical protein